MLLLSDMTVVEFGFESVVYPVPESRVAEVAVIKYGSSTLPLQVRLSTVSGSATSPQDYTQLDDRELTFSPEQRRQTVTISIVTDNTFEDTEEFTVVLTQLSPLAQVVSDATNTTIIRIIDDDCKEKLIFLVPDSFFTFSTAAIVIGFSPSQYTVSEGGGAVILNVTVDRSLEAESVVVQAYTVDGTASSKPIGQKSRVIELHTVSITGVSDFNVRLSTLEFTPDSGILMQVMVDVQDDNVLEAMEETFYVTLASTNPRVILQQSTANVTIIDNDGMLEKN